MYRDAHYALFSDYVTTLGLQRRALLEGRVEVPEFLDTLDGLVAPWVEAACKVTGSFQEWEAAFRAFSPVDPDRTVTERRRQTGIATDHGLTPKLGIVPIYGGFSYNFGTLILGFPPLTGAVTFVTTNLSEAGREWDAQKVLAYLDKKNGVGSD